MKNIWLIFKGDVRRVFSNSIGVMVVVGLALIPTLYAWFNIAACWEPYGNTGELKVAVANTDQGYTGDLLPVKVNIGDTVVSALRANDQYDWQFVSEEEATDGVSSGRYYAAIVIPQSFSNDMMTLFSDNQTSAKMLYYTNEKENPIAPRLTETGASAIQGSISQEFTSTVNQVGIETLADALAYLNSDQVKKSGAALTNSLDTTADELDTAATQVKGYASMAGATSSLVKSTSAILGSVNAGNSKVDESLEQVQKSLEDTNYAVDGVAESVNQALKNSSDSFDTISSKTDTAMDQASANASASATTLTTTAAQLRDEAKAYNQMADALDQALGQESKTATEMRATAKDLESLANNLDDVAKQLNTASTVTPDTKHQVDKEIREAQEDATRMQATYEREVAKKLSSLGTTLDKVRSSSSALSKDLDTATASLTTASGSLANQLDGAKESLASASETLDKAAQDLKDSNRKLKQALATGDLKKVQDIIGSDSVSLAQYLAAPVQMNRHAVYGIENYGSSMAPFYTCLSLWVAAVVFVVIMRSELSEARRRELADLRPCQEYFGRFGIFALLSLAQSTLVCLGDLYFMNIQCVHPFLFLLAGWVIGLAFTLFVYTLTLSFGNVGKAISVILLVMQVAGCGGIFPIQMEGALYQALYPFLPFIYAMRAMQSCVAGIFGGEYVISLLVLALLTVPFLLLGSVLRNPTIKLNRRIKEKAEETKFM